MVCGFYPSMNCFIKPDTLPNLVYSQRSLPVDKSVGQRNWAVSSNEQYMYSIQQSTSLTQLSSSVSFCRSVSCALARSCSATKAIEMLGVLAWVRFWHLSRKGIILQILRKSSRVFSFASCTDSTFIFTKSGQPSTVRQGVAPVCDVVPRGVYAEALVGNAVGSRPYAHPRSVRQIFQHFHQLNMTSPTILELPSESTRSSAVLLAYYFKVYTLSETAIPPPRIRIRKIEDLPSPPTHILAASGETVPKLYHQAKIVRVIPPQRDQVELLAKSGILSNSGQGKHPLAPLRLFTTAVPFPAIALAATILGGTKKIEVDLNKVPSYLNSFNVISYDKGLLTSARAANLLDGGSPFYKVVSTKDGKLAIGNLELKFYKQMLDGLGLTDGLKQRCMQLYYNKEQWGELDNIISLKFKEKTNAQWLAVFTGKEVCITEIADKVLEFRPQMMKELGATL